jgi:hypothetical protein
VRIGVSSVLKRALSSSDSGWLPCRNRLKGKAIRQEEAKLLRKREPFEEPIAVVTDLSVIVLAKEKEKARGVFGAFL